MKNLIWGALVASFFLITGCSDMAPESGPAQIDEFLTDGESPILDDLEGQSDLEEADASLTEVTTGIYGTARIPHDFVNEDLQEEHLDVMFDYSFDIQAKYTELNQAISTLQSYLNNIESSDLEDIEDARQAYFVASDYASEIINYPMNDVALAIFEVPHAKLVEGSWHLIAAYEEKINAMNGDAEKAIEELEQANEWVREGTQEIINIEEYLIYTYNQ